MSDLQIPDTAIHACALVIDPDEDPNTLAPEDINEIRDALVAAAPHIVAAELRRLADESTRRMPHLPPYGLALSSLELLNRAAELDGGAK